MFAQAILDLLFIGILIWIICKIFKIDIIDLFSSNEKTMSRLEARVLELQEVTDHLKTLRQEADVVEKLAIVQKELAATKVKLEKAEKKINQ